MTSIFVSTTSLSRCSPLSHIVENCSRRQIELALLDKIVTLCLSEMYTTETHILHMQWILFIIVRTIPSTVKKGLK